MIKEQAESFIRDTLGCQCPAELFQELTDEVELSAGPLFSAFSQADSSLIPFLDRVLSVGGRLLVVVTRSREKGTLLSLLAAGKVVRDNLGFNRLRVAVIFHGEQPGSVNIVSSGLDDRTHLHFLGSTERSGVEIET